jgi:hypothetical protein
MQTVNSEQVKAYIAILAAVAETIRERGTVPSGTLYALLMGRMSFEAYSRMIQQLKNAGLIEEKAHLLRWTGPEVSR